MFEDSVALIPSIWASMNSWCTPAVLFVLLNIMIGTIAFTSTLANQTKTHHQNQNQNQNQEQSQNSSQNHHHQQNNHSNNNNKQLTRSASLLQRFRSINFYNHRSQEPNLVTTTHFKVSPDSNTLYNIEHTHQSESLENAADYIFDQPQNQENQNQPSHDNNDDTHMQYDMFQKNHQQNVEDSNTQFFFDQIHEEKGEETDTHFDFEQEKSSNFEKDDEYDEDDGGDEFQSLDEVYSQLKGHHVTRTTSDTEPASGKVPAKLPKKMKKSASSKSAFGHFKADDIVEARRPATVRERGVAKTSETDNGVDAKADDFINKFKQQLKLQRMDSLMRYKDMITRGSGK